MCKKKELVFILPRQFSRRPVPEKPGRHKQRKDPGVLAQRALTSQLWVFPRHSFTSEKIDKEKDQTSRFNWTRVHYVMVGSRAQSSSSAPWQIWSTSNEELLLKFFGSCFLSGSDHDKLVGDFNCPTINAVMASEHIINWHFGVPVRLTDCSGTPPEWWMLFPSKNKDNKIKESQNNTCRKARTTCPSTVIKQPVNRRQALQ